MVILMRGLLGATTHLGDQPMLKTVAAGAAALFVAASPLAHAQTPSAASGSIKDIGTVKPNGPECPDGFAYRSGEGRVAADA